MAFDSYLFLKGYPGESTAVFKDKPQGINDKPCEIQSFSFGGSNPTTVGVGSGGLSGGRASVSSFNIMKKSEDLSAKLFQAMCDGDHIEMASVVCRKATGKDGKQQVFVQYDFTDVMVDSIQWSGSSGGDDTPTESLSLAFAKVIIQYFEQDTKTGSMKKASGAEYDLTKAQ